MKIKLLRTYLISLRYVKNSNGKSYQLPKIFQTENWSNKALLKSQIYYTMVIYLHILKKYGFHIVFFYFHPLYQYLLQKTKQKQNSDHYWF